MFALLLLRPLTALLLAVQVALRLQLLQLGNLSLRKFSLRRVNSLSLGSICLVQRLVLFCRLGLRNSDNLTSAPVVVRFLIILFERYVVLVILVVSSCADVHTLV